MGILQSVQAMFRGLRADGDKLLNFDPAVLQHDATISVSTPVFAAEGQIPSRYSADGDGSFPTIQWSGVPQDAQSLVLVVQDPDAPKPTPFVHLILYNVAPSMGRIEEQDVTDEGLSEQAKSAGLRLGTNSLGQQSWMAPTPPPGHGPHRYHFQVIALDTMLDFKKAPSLDDIRQAIQDHVLAYGEVVGVYERKAK